MPVGPTSNQTLRRERALRAKSLLASDDVKYIFRLAEKRALKSMREASTPTQAWEARALLMGHDELVGLLWLVAQDEKNVDREVSREEAEAVGAAAQSDTDEGYAEYIKLAQEARKTVRQNSG